MKSRSVVFVVLAGSIFFALAGTLCGKVLSYEAHSGNVACVRAVTAGMNADLVLLDSGMKNDFCAGALCVVEHDGVPAGELIVAEADADRAVALITQLNNNQTIRTGDPVKIKTITF